MVVRYRALLDTCVLYPITLCDVLLTLAETGLFEPMWSGEILEELERNLVRRAGLPPARTRYRISAMTRAFPNAEVYGYEELIPGLTCDPKDRHVLAAAVEGRSDVLVTANLKDFPPSSVGAIGLPLSVMSPDSFLCELFQLEPERMIQGLATVIGRSRHPAMTRESLLEVLASVAPTFVQEFAAGPIWPD